MLNRFFYLFTILFIVSCANSNSSNSTYTSEFVLSSMRIKQDDPSGNSKWSMKSPKAKYRIGQQEIIADQPEGLVYDQDKPKYQITASTARVINDGEMILLKGNVRLKQLKGTEFTIKGGSLDWTPAKSFISISETPVVMTIDSRISSERAELFESKDILLFHGNTKYEQWSSSDKLDTAPIVSISGVIGSLDLKSGVLQISSPDSHVLSIFAIP